MDTDTNQNTAPATNAAFAPTQIADAFDAALAAPTTEQDGAAQAETNEGGNEAADASKNAHSASVYNGRLGAAMRENNALKKSAQEKDEEIARLKAQLAEKEAAKAFSFDGIEGAENLDDDSRRIMGAAIDKVRAENKRQLDAIRQEYQADRALRATASNEAVKKETFEKVSRDIEARYPGFMARISSGGDLAQAWVAFTHNEKDELTGTYWGSALGEAAARGSTMATSRVIEEFVKRNNLARQHDGSGLNATPPASKGGADSFAGGVRDSQGRKVWPSKDAIFAAMEKVQRDERRGMISADERRKQLTQLEDDVREGRYVK